MPWTREANIKLNQALSNGDLVLFRALLDQFPANLRSSKGYCRWLTHAAKAGLFDFVKFLVEEMGIDPGELDSARDWSTVTPANWAIGNGHREIAMWLLEHGAEINSEYEGKAECQILKKAARMGDLELVKWLVEHGADVDACGLGNFNAYMVTDDPGVKEYLRSQGAIDLRDVTQLDYAAGHQKFIGLMSELGEEYRHWGMVTDWRMEYPGDPVIEMRCLELTELYKSRLLFTVGMSDVVLEVPDRK